MSLLNFRTLSRQTSEALVEDYASIIGTKRKLDLLSNLQRDIKRLLSTWYATMGLVCDQYCVTNTRNYLPQDSRMLQPQFRAFNCYRMQQRGVISQQFSFMSAGESEYSLIACQIMRNLFNLTLSPKRRLLFFYRGRSRVRQRTFWIQDLTELIIEIQLLAWYIFDTRSLGFRLLLFDTMFTSPALRSSFAEQFCIDIPNFLSYTFLLV